MAHILKSAGVSFGILGAEEKCCGDSLRRLGNEYIFEKLAKANIELFESYSVKKVICCCPHCYSTLKNDYKQFGFDGKVFHHSEFINDLILQGRLRFAKPNDTSGVVFHDSCYLGRYNDIYSEPRNIIEKAIGQKPLEMSRTKNKSFCCGAGGGRMWMEEEPENRINTNRVREALAINPVAIAVSCPYCMTMFEDGVKDEKTADKVKVLDIAEIVSARIES
jgi:Fe-S oxidoreductase